MKVYCWPYQLKETVLVVFTKRIKEIALFQLPGKVLICFNNKTPSLTAAKIRVTCVYVYSNSLSFSKTHLYSAQAR